MGYRLLLADDSITIQKVVGIIFADQEFELTVVDNGTSALEKARELHPDLMLVDALMPGLSGYEVCSEIRRDPSLSATPLLLMVGAFEPHDEEKQRDCGADASITKPFESQQLIDRVKELLELGARRRAAQPASPPEPQPVAAPVPPVAAAAPAAFSAALAAGEIDAADPIDLDDEILEATMEDDLWGAFELEPLPPAQTAPVAPAAIPVAEPEFEVEESFSFEEESEPIAETGPPLGFVPAAKPSAGEFLRLVEEPASEPLRPEPLSLPEYEAFSFEPEPTEVADTPITDFGAESAEASEPSIFGVPEEAPLEHEVPEPVLQAVPSAPLSEEQLRAAIAQVSREVIERIVWEVVPDLAEMLIKEEIRKLKTGTSG